MMSLIKKVLFAGVLVSLSGFAMAEEKNVDHKMKIESFYEYRKSFGKELSRLREQNAQDIEEKRLWTEFSVYADGSIRNIKLTNKSEEKDQIFIDKVFSQIPKWNLSFVGDSLRFRYPVDTKGWTKYFQELKYSIPSLHILSDERPEYTGGMDEFVRYLQSNIDQSLLSGLEKNKQNVVLSFYVNKKGQVKDVDLRAKNLSIPLKKELIRVVKNMPLWDIEGKTLKKDVAFSAYISLSKDGSFSSEILKSSYRATDGDKPAVFPGGMERLSEFLREETRYPQEALTKKLQGRVMCRLQIDDTGKIVNIELVKGVSPELDREALRVARALPDFEPAIFEGKKVKSVLVIPVTFRIPVVRRTEVRTVTYR